MTETQQAQTADIERLDAALADIDAETFTWKQRAWIQLPEPRTPDRVNSLADVDTPPCGTAMCLFGWAAWKAGYRPVRTDDWTPLGSYWAPGAAIKEGRGDDARRDIRDLGAELFRISADEAGQLSDEDNDRDDLQRMRDMLARGEDISDYRSSEGDDYYDEYDEYDY
jgi:hypothetical protein